MDIDVKCQNCGRTHKIPLDTIAKEGSKHCPCGTTINFKDEGGGARAASKSLGDLDKAIKKFGKS